MSKKTPRAFLATAHRSADHSTTGRARTVYIREKADGSLGYTPNRHQAAMFASEADAEKAQKRARRTLGLEPVNVMAA
jgi:hypothetical protein